jgi:hypothetical protein
MTDQLKAIQDDIAFLKGLVDEGGGTARTGGRIIAAAGVIYGAASLAHWLVQTGRIVAPGQMGAWVFPMIWLGATALFLGVLFTLKTRSDGPRTAGARASGIAWAGVGWTIFAMAASIAIVSWRADSPIPTLLFPSLILGLYGLGWMVAATVSRKSWIWMTSLASYAMALVVAWFSVTDWVMLIYAAALALLAVAPGVALMRQSDHAS